MPKIVAIGGLLVLACATASGTAHAQTTWGVGISECPALSSLYAPESREAQYVVGLVTGGVAVSIAIARDTNPNRAREMEQSTNRWNVDHILRDTRTLCRSNPDMTLAAVGAMIVRMMVRGDSPDE